LKHNSIFFSLQKEEKKMNKKYHVRERSFLNLRTSMRAYIIASVEDTCDIPNENEKDWKWGSIHLELADCTSEVSFEFDLSTAEERENSLYKIRKIAEVINAFLQAIETEAESIETRQAFKPLAKAAGTVH
jgi:hypothetical protein